jgi:hypothetical protein
MKSILLLFVLLLPSLSQAQALQFKFFECFIANAGTPGQAYQLVLDQNTATLALSESLGIAAVRTGPVQGGKLSYRDTNHAEHIFTIQADQEMLLGLGGHVQVLVQSRSKLISSNDLACRPAPQQR